MSHDTDIHQRLIDAVSDHLDDDTEAWAIEETEKLLSAGANPNAKNSRDYTVIMLLAMHGYFSEKIGDLLVKAGADINGRYHGVNSYQNGSTPLIMAARASSQGADPNAIQYLIEHGADANAIDDNGCNALCYIAMEGDPQAAKYLIEGGAKVNDYEGLEVSPLELALSEEGGENGPIIAQLLMNVGANADKLLQKLLQEDDVDEILLENLQEIINKQ